jgi:hypothetical protein
MNEYDFFEEEIPVRRPSRQPEDEDPTLDDLGGRREEDNGNNPWQSPGPRGGYTIRLPGLRDNDWGW